MSKYTTEVRYIVETNADPAAKTIKEKILSAAPKIFDFDFPIYEEKHRIELEEKILKHYYTREIGVETPGLWKLFLERRLNEIMPYYNNLYKAAALKIDPLSEYEESDTFKGTTTNTGDNTNTSTSKNKVIDSDFPQAAVDISSGNYATGATESADSSTATGTINNSGTNDYNSIKKGRHKSASLLILEYKEAILNVDLDIINELKDLFMQIY